MKLTQEQRTALIKRIADCRASVSLSDAEIGRATGVHPSQVGRVCRGEFRTMSGNVVQICKALGIGPEPSELKLSPSDEGWGRLEAALRATWDCTPDGAADLARVIEALGPLTRARRKY